MEKSIGETMLNKTETDKRILGSVAGRAGGTAGRAGGIAGRAGGIAGGFAPLVKLRNISAELSE
jgi:hypothetical protein